MHTSKVVFNTSNRKILIINLQMLSPASRLWLQIQVWITQPNKMVSMIANPSADYTNKKNGFLTRPLCHAEFYFLCFSGKQRQVWSAYGIQETRWRKGRKLFLLHLPPLRVSFSPCPLHASQSKCKKYHLFCSLKVAYQPIIIHC